MAQRISVVIVCFFAILACENIAEFSADKKSTEALLFQMQEHINNFEYDDALAVFNSMTTSQQSTRKARELYASSYMGKCGLHFVEFIEDISNGSGNLFVKLLGSMEDSTTITINDCRLAENIIDTNIATLTPLKSTEFNMALLNGLAKSGTIMNANGADVNNQLDPGFDPCNTGDISDVDTAQMVTALSRILSYIDESTLNFLGTTFDGACNIGEPLELAGLCDPVDTIDVSASQICAMRALMNESDVVGLGTCTGNITTCVCGGCPL